MKFNKNSNIKSLGIWLILIAIFIIISIMYTNNASTTVKINYSQFYKELNEDKIESVSIMEREIRGVYKNSKREFFTILPYEDSEIIREMIKRNVDITVKQPSNFWANVLPYLLPLLMFAFFWFILFRQMSSSQNRAFTFGKSKARMVLMPDVTFKDVAGVEEAKQELTEIVDFLKHPGKYTRLGGKIPKGVILMGAPGTGKTLLAKSVAGEAKVPFFTISGSDFVEMFVGVGASRVRDLFKKAKMNSPSIVFIDELDAVGRHRGAGIGGGHDEREQTLNQLLVEMDGFETNENVIVMAATNRPDILDPALLRPGRFDRRVVVERPDVRGREEIFKIHMRKVAVGDNVDVKVLAKSTPGFVGADIANMVNEAALLAARKDKIKVEMDDFEEAKDKIVMGLERKSAVISEEEKRISAYHECGHVLCSIYTEHVDPVHKVTVIPRGRALGVTMYLPKDDKHLYSREYLLDQLVALLGGRAAEHIVLNSVTTGAGNDIERATEIARKMVCEWGMSEKIGTTKYTLNNDNIFLGREIAQHKDYSDKTAQLIDAEIKSFVDKALKKAISILKEHRDELERMAMYLLERETLEKEDIEKIINGEELEEEKKNNKRENNHSKEDNIHTEPIIEGNPNIFREVELGDEDEEKEDKQDKNKKGN